MYCYEIWENIHSNYAERHPEYQSDWNLWINILALWIYERCYIESSYSFLKRVPKSQRHLLTVLAPTWKQKYRLLRSPNLVSVELSVCMGYGDWLKSSYLGISRSVLKYLEVAMHCELKWPVGFVVVLFTVPCTARTLCKEPVKQSNRPGIRYSDYWVDHHLVANGTIIPGNIESGNSLQTIS